MPIYAMFLAYTNDSLAAEDMPAASGGLVFTFGRGAIPHRIRPTSDVGTLMPKTKR